ncbi:transmembrane protein 268 isoform 2-T3 [Leptodactylus fuscus]|uniref:transmembrane protein 268 isoform X2 n=1 Tax=Leptodactylus fuscus TaxID=238119 RepID=UPI003F4E7BAA
MMTETDGGEGPRIDTSEPVVTLHSGLYNGRLLTVLPYTSRAVQAEQCLQRLQDCGIQLPVEQCKDSLQIPTLIPEVHRYIFFSSRGFIMILAMVIYASIWTNLYSTAQMFSSSHSWVTSIPVTITAAFVTVVVIFAINRNQKKDDIGKLMDQLFIFIETPADPALAQTSHENNVTEESPLLASGSRDKPVLCNKKIPLILQGHPEVMARQLLIISSACYVRLLTSGQLPRVHAAGHTGVLDVPCLCQFIESSILTSGNCFTCM